MFQDIVFPNNNEKEFLDTARNLGTKELIFVYEFKNSKDFERLKKEISDIKEFKVEIGILVDDKTINKISDLNIYIFSKTPSKNIVEHKKSYILYDFELQQNHDFLHHRNSGLNQALCGIIKEKEKIVGFSFSTILNAKNIGVTIGRMQQNASFSKKYKLKTIAASFAKTPYEMRAKHEIKSFEKIIGL